MIRSVARALRRSWEPKEKKNECFEVAARKYAVQFHGDRNMTAGCPTSSFCGSQGKLFQRCCCCGCASLLTWARSFARFVVQLGAATQLYFRECLAGAHTFEGTAPGAQPLDVEAQRKFLNFASPVRPSTPALTLFFSPFPFMRHFKNGERAMNAPEQPASWASS